MKSSRFEKGSFIWQHFQSTEMQCVSFIVCMKEKYVNQKDKNLAKN